MSDHGYDVFVFNYSGFGYSTGEAKDYLLHQDALTIIRYIDQERQKSNKPLYVISTSTGGNIFFRAWAEESTHIDGVIIDSSFDSYKSIALHTMNRWPLGYLYSWISRFVIRDDYAMSTVLSFVPESRFLVVHCIDDHVVPQVYSRRIYDSIKHQKELWLFNDCQHARTFTNQYPDRQERLLDWMKNTLRY